VEISKRMKNNLVHIVNRFVDQVRLTDQQWILEDVEKYRCSTNTLTFIKCVPGLHKLDKVRLSYHFKIPVNT